MNIFSWIVNFVLHLDTSLGELISLYGGLTYLILFALIFCETGLVVTPFLPGDSLLFAAGAFCAVGALNTALLLVVITVAAILGDTANYWIGASLLKNEKRLRFIKRKHLTQTAGFFDRHGGKTIVMARFIPIVRTFAPFVAGAGKMHYGRFITYNVIGGLLWSAIFILGGLFFGGLPVVRDNFSFVIVAVVVISFVPMAVMKLASSKKKKHPEEDERL